MKKLPFVLIPLFLVPVNIALSPPQQSTAQVDPSVLPLLLAGITTLLVSVISTPAAVTPTLYTKAVTHYITAFDERQTRTGVEVATVDLSNMVFTETQYFLLKQDYKRKILQLCIYNYSFSGSNVNCYWYTLPIKDFDGTDKETYDERVALDSIKKAAQVLGLVVGAEEGDIQRAYPFIRYGIAKVGGIYVVAITDYQFGPSTPFAEWYIITFDKYGNIVNYKRYVYSYGAGVGPYFIVPYLPRAVNVSLDKYQIIFNEIYLDTVSKSITVQALRCNIYGVCDSLEDAYVVPAEQRRDTLYYIVIKPTKVEFKVYNITSKTVVASQDITQYVQQFYGSSANWLNVTVASEYALPITRTYYTAPYLIWRVSHIFPEYSDYAYVILYKYGKFPIVPQGYGILIIDTRNKTVEFYTNTTIISALRQDILNKDYTPSYPFVTVVEGGNVTLHYIWLYGNKLLNVTQSGTSLATATHSIYSEVAITSAVDNKYITLKDNITAKTYTGIYDAIEFTSPTFAVTSTGGYVLTSLDVNGKVTTEENYMNIYNYGIDTQYFPIHPAVLAQFVGVEVISVEMPTVTGATPHLKINDVQAIIPENLYKEPNVTVNVSYTIANISFARLLIDVNLGGYAYAKEATVYPNATYYTTVFNLSQAAESLHRAGVRTTSLIVNVTLYAGNLTDNMVKNYTVKLYSEPVKIRIISPQPNTVYQQGQKIPVKVNITDPDTSGNFRIKIYVLDENNVTVKTYDDSISLSKPVNYTYTYTIPATRTGKTSIVVTVYSPDASSDTASANIYVNRRPAITNVKIQTEPKGNTTKYGYVVPLPDNVNKSKVTISFVVSDDNTELYCSVSLDNNVVWSDMVVRGIETTVEVEVPAGNHTITILCEDPYGAQGSYSIKMIVNNPDNESLICNLVGGYWAGAHCCGDDVGEETPLQNSIRTVFLPAYCKNVILPEGYCLTNADCSANATKACWNETHLWFRNIICNTSVNITYQVTINGEVVNLTVHRCEAVTVNITKCPDNYLCTIVNGEAVCKPYVPPTYVINVTFYQPPKLVKVKGLKKVTLPVVFAIHTERLETPIFYLYVDGKLVALNSVKAGNITYNITFTPPSQINVNVTHTVKVKVKGYYNGQVVEKEFSYTFKIWYIGGFDNPTVKPEPTCTVFYDNQTNTTGYYIIDWVWDNETETWKPVIVDTVTCPAGYKAVKYNGECACVKAPQCVSDNQCTGYKEYCNPEDEEHLTLVKLIPKCVNGTCVLIPQIVQCPAGTWCPPTSDSCVPYGECSPPIRYFCINSTYSGRYVHVFNTTLGRCVWKLVEVRKCDVACYPETGKCDIRANTPPQIVQVIVNKTIVKGGNDTIHIVVQDLDDEMVLLNVTVGNYTIYKEWVVSGLAYDIPIGKLVKNIPDGTYTLIVYTRDPYFASDTYETTIEIVTPTAPPAGGGGAPAPAPAPTVPNVTPTYRYNVTGPTGFFLARPTTWLGLLVLVVIGIIFYLLYRREKGLS